MGGLRQDQSSTHEAKPCWDGHKGEQGGETSGFAPVSAGLVLPRVMEITNMERADFLPDLAPRIYQITELLQRFKLRSWADGTGERLWPQMQAPVLDTEARAEVFATRGSSFAPEKQTN